MDNYAINEEIDARFIPDIDDIFTQTFKNRHKKQLQDAKKNYFRALGRLVLFFFTTAVYFIYHLVTGSITGFTNKKGADSIQKWSRAVLSLMGVDIVMDGTPPESGVLMVSNHRSYIDIVVAGKFIKTSFLAKSQLKSWPLLGIGAKVVNVLFVDRDSAQSRRQSREDIKTFLESGTSFFVYPEGTTSEGPGLLPFRPGVFKLAAENEIPVVPVAVYYDDIKDAWIGDDTFFRHFFQTFSKKRITARISFGPVLGSSNVEKLRTESWQWINNRLTAFDAYRISQEALLKDMPEEQNIITEITKNFNQLKFNLDNVLMKIQYNPYRYEFLYKPGTWMTDEQLEELTTKIRETALTSFDALPDYQVLRGTREEFSDKVIALAWCPDGSLAGFCSTVIFNIDGVGDVQHLGLTVVRPQDRSNGLTHILTSRAVKGYLMKHKPLFGKLWITNCAAVLSSLVNVAKYFEDIYPSPFHGKANRAIYDRIAAAIDEHYRDKIYISEDAFFDHDSYVFRKSVEGTVFKKDRNDKRFHHRNSELNNYYKNMMNFEDGDEVLQIGYVSTLAAFRHMYERSIKNIPFVQGDRKRKSA